MNCVLSAREQTIALGDYPFADLRGQLHRDVLCKAEAHHLLKVLKEPCTEHPTVVIGGSYNNGNIIKRTKCAEHRYLCPDCMKQIEKEIEG